MGSRYLDGMADMLRAFGVAVVEVDHMSGGTIVEGKAWQRRARGSGGFDGDKPWAICWHHTASNPGTSAESNVAYGTFNSDNAPVMNLYLHDDGVVYVCAGGATNTEGKGGPLSVSKGTIPLDAANTYCIGVEAGNSGVGEPWPQVQIDAYHVLSLALAEWLGLDLGRDVITHHQWTPPRKIDPATAAAVQGAWRPGSITSSGTWSDDDIRAEAVRRAGPAPIPVPPEPGPDPGPPSKEDEMLVCVTDVNGTAWVGNGIERITIDSDAVFNTYRVVHTNRFVNTSGKVIGGWADVSQADDTILATLGRPR
jgi:hypothetical protein